MIMSVVINGETFNAKYLTTPEEIQKGMMGKKDLDGCLVFLMDKGHHSFWMKDCLISLDIVFVNNGKISRIHSNCPPAGRSLNPPRYTGIGDRVIEFKSGTADKWKVGDRVYFSE